MCTCPPPLPPPLLPQGPESCTPLDFSHKPQGPRMIWSRYTVFSMCLSLPLSFLASLHPLQTPLLTRILPSPAVLSVISLASSVWFGESVSIHEAARHGTNRGQQNVKILAFYCLAVWSLASYWTFLPQDEVALIVPQRNFEAIQWEKVHNV